jgi:hypothetical protein
MSYNNHKRQALEEWRPIKHRMSHLRSCTVHISERHKVHRDLIIEKVLELTGLDLYSPLSNEELVTATQCLDQIREKWPGPVEFETPKL